MGKNLEGQRCSQRFLLCPLVRIEKNFDEEIALKREDILGPEINNMGTIMQQLLCAEGLGLIAQAQEV
jgi:hypothetical protein